MNTFVADPHWGWWIVGYFFLGGIAAGAYFTAALIDLRTVEADRRLARIGYAIAFPLILVCGVFLILDLDRPERFWHMLVKSEVVYEAIERGWPWSGEGWSSMVHAPLFKPWSPMSIGSWALSLFGLCSSLSLLGSLWPGGRLERWLRRGVFGCTLQIMGSLVGFFVASYTGALLTATSQPLWSDHRGIGALFLISAASTGLAAISLVAHVRGKLPPESLGRLESRNLLMFLVEGSVVCLFLATLGPLLWSVWDTATGKLLILAPLALAFFVPLGIRVCVGHSDTSRRLAVTAALSVLLGGLALRYGILRTAPELAAHKPAMPSVSAEAVGTPAAAVRLSPEDGRRPGEGQGADPGNRGAELKPRSRVLNQP